MHGVGVHTVALAVVVVVRRLFIMLQVEQQNRDARALYGRCGFDELFEEENGRALRPRPGRQTRVSALLLMENAALLEEVPSIIVTMAKEVGVGGDAG